MKYFLPDSQDLVDPSFDFKTEQRSRSRLRQRDDLYAHEVFRERPFDGLLVSKGIVDGAGATGGRYTLAQRERLLRSGAPEFFRARFTDGEPVPVMGDCGAFTYVKEPVPPYTPAEVVEFYAHCGFDFGISVDHIILAFDPSLDVGRHAVPKDFRDRQEITLDLASTFKKLCTRGAVSFIPIGVAQGWSPKSYANAVTSLQRMGYDYIAIGGMVPLKTDEILQILHAVAAVRRPATRFHLLGVTRLDQAQVFASLGVASFDSTSPLRQAFKDDKDNYYTLDRTYVAIRIPQVEGNAFLQQRIAAGRVSQTLAMKLERTALAMMASYSARKEKLQPTLDALLEYERLFHEGRKQRDNSALYSETLAAAPWKSCPCDVCRMLGHHVIIFRGAERNRRRGFHNVWTFYRRMRADVGQLPSRSTARREVRS